MFCPSCRDEFRPGFTRCGRCDVDLVEALGSAPAVQMASRVGALARPLRLVDYCGFFTIEEAQEARLELRGDGIRCEIVIREPAEADLDQPPRDEFWLRIDADRLGDAEKLLDLGAVATEAGEDGEPDGEDFECSACGHLVAASASTCPTCGARFDDER